MCCLKLFKRGPCSTKTRRFIANVQDLIVRLLLASFRITGYFFVALVQIVYYLALRKPDKIGVAIGYLGHGTVDAIADALKPSKRR
jgi:hypothetical protein